MWSREPVWRRGLPRPDQPPILAASTAPPNEVRLIWISLGDEVLALEFCKEPRQEKAFMDATETPASRCFGSRDGLFAARKIQM